MEEILTLYPQLLPLFQNEKIQMPSEMATPIAELCKEANVDFTSFIQNAMPDCAVMRIIYKT